MSERPGSQVWRRLLRAALQVADSLPAAGYGPLAFRMGGGTVLAFAFGHRVSNDIDLFIDDVQALGFLTPRLNDAARLTDTYQETANALKLVLPEGDIDFIVAASVTREPAQEHLDIDGRRVPLEPVAEILAKKLLYRAASLKPRDVFDLALALADAPDAGRRAIAAVRSVHPLLLRRLASLRDLAADALTADIVFTDTGHAHIDGMIDRVAQAIEQCT